MKKELSVYYITRAALALLIGFLFTKAGWPLWGSVLIAILMFGLFVWYAHSGHFLIDESTPLTPLRRDARAKVIRDRALVSAVVIGGVTYGLMGFLSQFTALAPAVKNLALVIGLLAYFVISQVMFTRDAK